MNLSEAFDDAYLRFSDRNFTSLSERDQILIAICGLEADVNNGGFDQYYFNSSGDQAWFAPMALRRIGAHHIAAIAERANALFGPDGPPSDGDERQCALLRIADASEGAWDRLDQEFYAFPDDIAALLGAHFGLAAGT